jgi:hypothetical protein
MSEVLRQAPLRLFRFPATQDSFKEIIEQEWDRNEKRLTCCKILLCLFKAVLRIHDILGRIRIRILDPDPAIFVIDLQDASKR